MEGVDRGGKLVTAPRKFAVASEAESDECIPAARRRPRPRTRAWYSGVEQSEARRPHKQEIFNVDR